MIEIKADGFFKKTFYRSLAYCFELINLILAFYLLGIGLFSGWLEAYSPYSINYSLIERIILFSSIVFSILFYRLGQQINVTPLIESKFVKSLLLHIFFLIFFGYVFLLWHRHFDLPINTMLLAAILFLGLYAYKLFDLYFYRLNVVLKRELVGCLVIISLLLPIFTSKYINSESYLDLKVINSLVKEYSAKIDYPFNSDLIRINLEKSDVDFFKKNFEKISLSTHYHEMGIFELIETEHKSTLEVNVTPENLSVFCLLGTSYDNDQQSLFNCIASLNSVSSRDKTQMIENLSRVNFLNNRLAREIITKTNSVHFVSLSLKDQAHIQDQVGVMFLRGGFFHHYNSICSTLNMAGSINAYYANQYGLGPLLVVQKVSQALRLKFFDAIYISTVLSLVFVFFVLLFTTRAYENKHIIFYGFAISILTTYSSSNMMAPFLYFIRYLPSIFLFLLIHHLAVNKRSMKSSNYSCILFNAILIMVSIYNFEYAILTFASLIFAGLISRNKFYLLTGVGYFIAEILMKFLISPATTNTINTNYLAYISGVGVSEAISAMALFYFGSLLLVFLVYIKLRKSNQISPEITALGSLVLLLSFKVVWSGAGNHVGPLFLMLGLFLHALMGLSKESEKMSEIKIFHFIWVVLLIQIFIIYPQFKLNNHIKSVDYTKASFSNFFYIPKDLATKSKSLIELYKHNDVVISPIDNFLELIVKEKITTPYPDVSTNINADIDLYNILHAIKQSSIRRVIIDNDVIDVEKLSSSSAAILNLSPGLLTVSHTYFNNLQNMRKIYEVLILSGYKTCESNDHFTVVCIN